MRLLPIALLTRDAHTVLSTPPENAIKVFPWISFLIISIVSFMNFSEAIFLSRSNNNSITNNSYSNNEIAFYLEESYYENLTDLNFFYNNDVDIKTEPVPPVIRVPGIEIIFFVIIAFIFVSCGEMTEAEFAENEIRIVGGSQVS